MVHSAYVQVSTLGHADMHDITRDVEKAVEETGMRNGLVTVFTASSTSALTTIEYESGALVDLKRTLDEIAPPDRDYKHNLRWGDGNGHSHLRAALMKPSLSIPVIDGSMTLGTWQQILFIDFDVRPRQRELVIQIIGEDE